MKQYQIYTSTRNLHNDRKCNSFVPIQSGLNNDNNSDAMHQCDAIEYLTKVLESNLIYTGCLSKTAESLVIRRWTEDFLSSCKYFIAQIRLNEIIVLCLHT